MHSRSSGVTLRENTERPETVDVRANVLAGVASEKIMSCAMRMLETDTIWKNPFGDGRTGERNCKDYRKLTQIFRN